MSQAKMKRIWKLMTLPVAAMGLGCIVLLQLPCPLRAQDKQDDDLRRRVEQLERLTQRLEQQNSQLQQQNDALQRLLGPHETTAGGGRTGEPARSDVERIVVETLEAREAQRKRDEEARKRAADAAGYEVGGDLNFRTFWKDGFTAETAHKDFRVHFGGRVHGDVAWFAPDAHLNQAFPNQWNDGAEFRRLRLRADGTMYEVLEWVLEIDFQTAVAGTTNHPVPTDAYLSLTQLPVVGAVDVGHFKEPFSLDDYGTPDNYVILMERSVADNAFGPARNLGVMLHNTALENTIIWGAGVFRTNSDNASGSAFDYGDEEYAFTGRVVALPIYADGGRCWVLVGGAYSHRIFNPNDGGVNGANASRVRYGARMPIRVNSPVLVDTTSLVADNVDLFNLQAAVVWGPLMLQGEYFHTDVHDIRRGTVAPGVPRVRNASFDGFYVQASWLLTGEHHPIDRERARMNRVRPHETFFFVARGDEGLDGCCLGKGAWEVAARYDYLDVSSPTLGAFPGAPAIASAGYEQAITLGLNWYLSPNARFAWNYAHAFRGVSSPTARGGVDAFGARVIFDF
jgi:phosphate-selective porin OprO/OprP